MLDELDQEQENVPPVGKALPPAVPRSRTVLGVLRENRPRPQARGAPRGGGAAGGRW